jgi:hypothetical protein
MKIIFLYGPPASGKLTVAEKLSKLTGYKICHNHLTADFAIKIFPWGSAEYGELVTATRLKIVELAAKTKGPGLIFTHCYGHPVDLPFIRKICRVVRSANSNVFFYQIICDQKELFKRIGNRSRTSHKKIRSPKVLREVLNKFDLYTPIPGVNSLPVDTGKLSAGQAAKMIYDDIRKRQ